MENIKLLFIGGAGRSGSTLIERILGECSKFVCVGEVTFIWERGFLNNQLCSCGKRFRECSFWREVILNTEYLKEAMVNQNLIKHILWLRNSVSRLRYMPYFVLGFYPDAFRKVLNEYLIFLFDLYRSIKQVSGAEFIVDSSKSIHGHVIANLDKLTLFVSHLVRDGRAVVYSWSRKKIYEKYKDNVIEMPTFGPVRSSMFWIMDNLAALSLKKRVQYYRLFLYENFAKSPKKFFVDLFDFLALDPELFLRKVFIDENVISLTKPIHSASGNPSRFLNGQITIRLDDKWKSLMTRKAKILSTLLEYPLLKKFGYL